MKLSNEYKRTRKKLELLNQEGAFQLLYDLIDEIIPDASDTFKLSKVLYLQRKYQGIMNKIKVSKQINLFTK